MRQMKLEKTSVETQDGLVALIDYVGFSDKFFG